MSEPLKVCFIFVGKTYGLRIHLCFSISSRVFFLFILIYNKLMYTYIDVKFLKNLKSDEVKINLCGIKDSESSAVLIL